MTNQEIKSFINTYIVQNGVNAITGSQLNTALNALADYYGFDSVVVTTLPASSEATVNVQGRTLELGIPKGADGQNGRDGLDATNPFKGWFNSLDDLKASYTAAVGDSAYVKDASPATTWSIYIYDETATTDNNWADSGMKADTSNVQTFASGQEVNLTSIKDAGGNVDQGISGVFSADAGKFLAGCLSYKSIDLNGEIVNAQVDTNGNYVQVNNIYSVIVDFSAYAGKTIQLKRNESGGNAVINFLTSNNLVLNQPAPFCATMQGRQIYTEDCYIAVPSDCNYLLILNSNTGQSTIPGSRFPTMYALANLEQEFGTIGSILTNIEGGVTEINIDYENDLLQAQIDNNGFYRVVTTTIRTKLVDFSSYAGKRVFYRRNSSTNKNVVVSFLKSNSLIDGQIAPFCDSLPMRQIYSVDGWVDVPLDCNYILILVKTSPTDLRYPSFLGFPSEYAKAPAYGYGLKEKKPNQFETRFSTLCECVQPQLTSFDGVSIDTIKTSSVFRDNCVLYLPSTYQAKGKPTKLIIFCKQGGTKIGVDAANDWAQSTQNQSPIFNLPFMAYLISIGYAVLAADGEPDGWLESLNLGTGQADLRTVGNYVAVQSTRKAYDYVIQNYNIEAEGCFIFGYSQGGHYAQNVIDLSGIPILAAAEVCPACSYKFHQWDITISPTTVGDVSNCTWAARLNIARMFGFGGSITTNQQLADLDYDDCKDYLVGYDPWTRGVDLPFNQFEKNGQIYQFASGVTVDDVTMKKSVKCPVKIWCGDSDTVLGVDVMKTFTKAVKNAGGVADITVYSNQGHRFFDQQTTLGNVVLNGTTYPYKPIALDIVIWFRSFGGY